MSVRGPLGGYIEQRRLKVAHWAKVSEPDQINPL